MLDRIRDDVTAVEAFVRSPAGRPWIATVAGYGVAIGLLFVLLFVVPFVLVSV